MTETNNLFTNPSIAITDTTKLTDFIECPRKFFFNQRLGWQREQGADGNVHLVFGSAFHEGAEWLSLNGYGGDALDGAMDAFMSYWRLTYPPAGDNTHDIKNPGNARRAYTLFIERYSESDKEWAGTDAVWKTEIAGTVPIRLATESEPERRMAFRIDAVIKTKERGFWFKDTKTGSRIDKSWSSTWPLSIQMGCYTHVLNCMFGVENTWGGIVDGVFLYKSKDPEFVRVPIRRSRELMNSWLTQVNYWFDLIEHNDRLLKEDHKATLFGAERHLEDPPLQVMRAFTQAGRESGACTKFWGCRHADHCKVWSNPLAHATRPPIGFEERFWNPLTVGESDAAERAPRHVLGDITPREGVFAS